MNFIKVHGSTQMYTTSCTFVQGHVGKLTAVDIPQNAMFAGSAERGSLNKISETTKYLLLSSLQLLLSLLFIHFVSYHLCFEEMFERAFTILAAIASFRK